MTRERVNSLVRTLQSAKPEIRPERALLVTESYMETEGLPIEIRRAKMLEKLLAEIPVKIRTGELIVGCKTLAPMGSPLYPEVACDWILREIDTIGQRKEAPFLVSEGTKSVLKKKVFPYWNGKQVYNRIMESVPEVVRDTIDEGVFFHYYLNRTIGHISVNYEKVLRKGLDQIRLEIEEELANVDYERRECLQKINLLEAMLIVSDAAIKFAGRYADEARRLARTQKNKKRRKELEAIAEICDRVPANPARTFYEALQSFWFIHLILNLEANSYAISPGRFDQYMYPYYKRDCEDGRLSRDSARELLECLWVKFNELTVAKEGGTAKASITYADFQNLNIGGQTADGEDATNELSYLCLDVAGELKLIQPQLSVLISSKSPHKFLIKACEVIRMGFGMPAMFNDDEKMMSMLDKGKLLEDARMGSINGCVELCVQGKENMASSGYLNLAKCLELALNNGINPLSGKQIGPKTGDPVQFRSFDILMEAFRKQVEYFVDVKVIYDSIARRAYAEFCLVPFTSMLIDGCIEKGRDYHDGGAVYNLPMICGVGTGTTADSLAAIKKLVFEDKMIKMRELLSALKSDFRGHERLRQMLMHRAAKYGNDDEYVDLLAREIVDLFCGALKKHRNFEGVPYAANMIPTTTHIYFGELTGATPDGRRAREPLSEGVSPVQGRDIHGPTAVLKSISKLNHVKCSGTLLNMKFHPSALAGEDGLEKFASLIRTYFDLGGHHMQFNVISKETLRDAQKHPERYQNLVIRVAGYSDYFVRLSKELQDEIITRTSHGF